MFAQGDNRPLASTTLPPGILPCVWMSAGLVAFKLCDREGECEGCPFDRAMQGARSEPPAASAGLPAPSRGPGRRSPSRRTGRRPAPLSRIS